MIRRKLTLVACGLVASISGCAVPTTPEYYPYQPAYTRGDNPNLPSPVTPSSVNESASPVKQDPTNTTGFGR